MIAAASHTSVTPWVLLSAAATVLGILAGAVKVGRWAASVEARLKQHDKDLRRLGRAESALERDRDDH